MEVEQFPPPPNLPPRRLSVGKWFMASSGDFAALFWTYGRGRAIFQANLAFYNKTGFIVVGGAFPLL